MRAHSKSEYKRLRAMGVDVPPPTDSTEESPDPVPPWTFSPRDEGSPGDPRCSARVFDRNRRDFRQCLLHAKTLHDGYPVCNRHAAKLDPLRRSIIALD